MTLYRTAVARIYKQRGKGTLEYIVPKLGVYQYTLHLIQFDLYWENSITYGITIWLVIDTPESTEHAVTDSISITLHYSMSVHWHILTYSSYSGYELVYDKFYRNTQNTLEGLRKSRIQLSDNGYFSVSEKITVTISSALF